LGTYTRSSAQRRTALALDSAPSTCNGGNQGIC
jgi:hypothetical protein